MLVKIGMDESSPLPLPGCRIHPSPCQDKLWSPACNVAPCPGIRLQPTDQMISLTLSGPVKFFDIGIFAETSSIHDMH